MSKKIVILGFVVLLLITGGVFWWQSKKNEEELWGPTQWSGKNDYLIEDTSEGKIIKNKKVGLSFMVPKGWRIEENESGLKNKEYYIEILSPDARFDENNFLTEGCIFGEEIFYDMASFGNTNAEINAVTEKPKESKYETVIIYEEAIDVNGRKAFKITRKSDNPEGFKKLGELIEIKIPFGDKGIIHFVAQILPGSMEMCHQELDRLLETVKIE